MIDALRYLCYAFVQSIIRYSYLFCMRVIKRYPNRKLYDTEAKRYVSLEQLFALIRQGAELQVVEHESGADVTNTILTQIILEQEKQQGGVLPRSLLMGLIRSGGATIDHMRHSLLDGTPRESLQALLNLDERIATVLHTLNIPTQQEFQQLHDQLDALERRLDGLLAANDPTVTYGDKQSDK